VLEDSVQDSQSRGRAVQKRLAPPCLSVGASPKLGRLMRDGSLLQPQHVRGSDLAGVDEAPVGILEHGKDAPHKVGQLL
jgi:hypothetical protein